jgi:hypothetical protein
VPLTHGRISLYVLTPATVAGAGQAICTRQSQLANLPVSGCDGFVQGATVSPRGSRAGTRSKRGGLKAAPCTSVRTRGTVATTWARALSVPPSARYDSVVYYSAVTIVSLLLPTGRLRQGPRGQVARIDLLPDEIFPLLENRLAAGLVPDDA